MTAPALLVAQCGGPTAVVNASLAGVIDGAHGPVGGDPGRVLGVEQGLRGLVEGRTRRLTREEAAVWRDLPGAALGSGRFAMGEEHWWAALETCRIHRADRLVLIGGNGTMLAAARLQRMAVEAGADLRVVGVPKTVDNDLHGTDWSPGFPSAARFLALAVRDIGLDLVSMRDFEQVRVIETMGRNTGWLARSTALLRRDGREPPHLVYTPEMGVSDEAIIAEVATVQGRLGHAVVVASEGLEPRDTERHLREPLLGGVAPRLARRIGEELGVAARGEILGTLQRSASLAVSPVDRRIAYALGRAAAEHAAGGAGGVMVGVAPDDLGPDRVVMTVLEHIGGRERLLPGEWVGTPDDPCEPFVRWLRPLVGLEASAVVGRS